MKLISLSIFFLFLNQQAYTQLDDFNTIAQNEMKSRTLKSNKVLENGFNVTEVLQQIWENGNWNNVTRDSYSIDSNNVFYLLTTETWDSTAWVNELQTWFTYDENDNATEEITKIWDGGDWVNSERLLNEYDGNQNTILETYQSWGGSDWINFEKTKYTYNNNLLTEELYQSWNGSVWENVERYQYIFAGNNLTEELYQTWQGSWLNSTLDLHTYDGNNNEIESESKICDNNQWIIEKRFTNQYSNGNLTVVTLQEGWLGTVWSNLGLYTKHYNNNNLMIDYISQYWHSANGWTNQQKWILSYSTDNQLLDWTTQFWYTTQWENYSRLRSVYDINGNMVIYAWENWENSAWQNHIQLLFTYVPITNVEDEIINPDKFSLLQNYPNPFNPTTRIQYSIGSMQHLKLKVYDVLGNEVATLVNEYKPAGSYEVEFDASGLTSGVYFYKLQAESFIETKKMILLR